MAEFFSMGGYGIYLWPSWGLCIVALAANYVHARHKLNKALGRLREDKQ